MATNKYNYRILVLGNGFDVYHGMKTSFHDLKVYIENNSEKLEGIIQKCVNKIDDDSKMKEKLLENKVNWSSEWVKKKNKGNRSRRKRMVE